jgi:hypothetical protein
MNDHPEIQMWTVGEPGAADRGDSFAAVNCFATLCQGRRDQAEMTVNANETIVLNQNLQATDTASMNPDDSSWCDRGYRAADGRGKIDPIMECSRQRFVE